MEFDFKEIPCPVCEGGESSFLGWRGGDAHQSGAGVKTAIVRCRACSHQYPNPMPFPKGSLDEMYVDADEYFRGHDVERKKQRGLGLMKDFERCLGRKGNFLDVGCGAGELLWAATNSGWNAVGIDPSEEFVRIGRERLGVEAKVTTLEEAAYPDETFDAVAMGGLIEHLYEPRRTLSEVKRILRPGGLLYFDAPNEDGLYMNVGNLYMRLRGRDWVVVTAPTFPPYHVQGFNRRSLTYLIEQVGLDLLSLRIEGGIWSQRGKPSVLKKIEFAAARATNYIGKKFNRGSYMEIWVRKPGN